VVVPPDVVVIPPLVVVVPPVVVDVLLVEVLDQAKPVPIKP
jgi:hypothetical protein